MAPVYNKDPKREPKLENCPCRFWWMCGKRASVEVEADASLESLKQRAHRVLQVLGPPGAAAEVFWRGAGRSTNDQRREVDDWRHAHPTRGPGAA